MSWSLKGTATAAHATASNFALTKPASAAGDVGFVCTYQESDNFVATTPPTGWTLLTPSGENAGSGPDTQYRAWYRVFDGSEPSTLTFTHSSVYRAAVLLIMTPTATPATLGALSAATAGTTQATTLSLAAITTTADDALVVAGYTNYNEENISAITSPYSVAVQAVGGQGGGAAAAWNNQAGAGTTGAVVATFGLTTYACGALHSFNPGAGAPVTSFVPNLRRAQKALLVR